LPQHGHNAALAKVLGLYALVAVMWFIPDRRIESTLHD
jgi:hypothetical protein